MRDEYLGSAGAGRTSKRIQAEQHRKNSSGIEISELKAECVDMFSPRHTPCSGRRCGGRRSGIVTAPGYEMPHEEHNHCADHGTDQPGIFALPVDMECLSDKGRNECSRDAQNARQDEAL